jgi:monoamine oxidase
MENAYTRRRFIGLGAAASSAVVLGAGGARRSAARPRRKRVVILGAGLAGLSAAYELQKTNPGVEIVLLEARDRVGGRVLTVRTHQNAGKIPFADGQYVEAGAHRIPETHDRTLGYVRALGLGGKVVEFSTALGNGQDGQMLHVLKGRRFVYDGVAWPSFLAFTPEERLNDFFSQDLIYEFDWVTGAVPPQGNNHLGNPVIALCQAANWPPGDGIQATLEEWNTLTVAQFLASHGASADWIRLYAAENGTEIHGLGALAWLVQSHLDFDWIATLYLDGGLDQLPRTLAAVVAGNGAPIRLNHVVRAVEQERNGVRVTYRDARGGPRTLAADRIVCTVPFPVLRAKVDLRRARLAADKLRWIRTLQMASAARISLQMNHRFWRDEGIEGLKLAATDTAAERLWHSTNTQAGQSGIVQAYLQADNALAASAQKHKLRWVRDEIAALAFPLIRDEWNGRGVAKLWHDDEWAGGAWLSPKPHQFLQGFHTWGRAEGRIHFAGEHTSLYAGWMQGGIESGQRAACEVAAAL